MSTITREELKEKLDRGEDFKLINCLDDWMFRAKRIPGSIHFESLKHAHALFPVRATYCKYGEYISCRENKEVARILNSGKLEDPRIGKKR